MVPFLVCTSLGLFFTLTEPNPDALYGRKAIYFYLSGSWLFIGIILSALALAILLIYDAFEFREKAAKRRKLMKMS